MQIDLDNGVPTHPHRRTKEPSGNKLELYHLDFRRGWVYMCWQKAGGRLQACGSQERGTLREQDGKCLPSKKAGIKLGSGGTRI